MGTHYLRVRLTASEDADKLHWSGLPPPALHVGVWVLVVVTAADLSGQLLIILRRSLESLVQGTALNAWDLLKAVAIAILLLWTALRARNRNIAAFAVLFLLVGIEDQIQSHFFAARLLGGLLRSVGLAEGQRSNQIGEFLALAGLAVVGAALAWGWRRSALRSLRRARLILSIHLVALFTLAAVLNLVGQLVAADWLSIVEEVGERLVLSLALAYASGLATVKEWWAQP